MNEVSRALKVLRTIQLEKPIHRNSLLGRYLSNRKDHVAFDTFDVYFNRNKNGEGIDLQVGSYIFNLGAWTEALHRLAELLVLKGAKVEDIEQLGREVIQISVDIA